MSRSKKIILVSYKKFFVQKAQKFLIRDLSSFAGLGVCFIICLFTSTSFALSDKIYKELETFSQLIEIVDKEYVEEVDEHELVQGAIRGMLEALDPYTIYLPPDMYKDFKSETTGKFGGIGIEVTLKDSVLTVVSPIEDSPAYRVGIRSGDRILKIDGKPTKEMNLMDAVHAMRGPKGKKVLLTIWREGFTQPRDYAVTREIIEVESIKSELLEENYGYVRITSFQEKTGESLKKALKDLEEQGTEPLKGIILDLRDNPGGLLSQAVEVSDIFMDKDTIVSTKGRDQKPEVKVAKNNSPYEEIPLVVLINHGSASASEIVAGALQDTRRAKVIGISSFGKGSVQTILDMGDNAALKITVAKYYTPKGRSIEKEGVKPDIVIDQARLNKDLAKIPEKERPTLQDYQKQEALDLLKQ